MSPGSVIINQNCNLKTKGNKMDKDTNRDKDAIFNGSLSNDYSSDSFEIVVNVPDFWVTASRWISKANKNQNDNDIYEITPKKISRLISLLTAQPVNAECDKPYEDFVIAAHDFLLASSEFMLNAKKEKELNFSRAELSLPNRPLDLSYENPIECADIISDLNRQVKEKNTWSLGPDHIENFSAMAKKGEFPLFLISPENIYHSQKSGERIASIENIENIEDLTKIMACLLHPEMMGVLFDRCVQVLYPGANPTFDKDRYTFEEIISIGIESDLFKSAFKVDWDEAKLSVAEKIQEDVAKLSPDEPVYTQIKDPEVEYKDPAEKALQDYDISPGR